MESNDLDLYSNAAAVGGCGWGGRVVVLQPEGRQFDPQSSQKESARRSVLEQDAEPRIVPHRTTKVLLIDALYECVCVTGWM